MDLSLSKLKQLNALLLNPDFSKREEREVFEDCGEMVKDVFRARELDVEKQLPTNVVELFLSAAKEHIHFALKCEETDEGFDTVC